MGYAIGTSLGKSIVQRAVGKMVVAHVANTAETVTEIFLDKITNPNHTSQDVRNEIGQAGYEEITVVGSTPSLDIAQSIGLIPDNRIGDIFVEIIQTGFTYIPDMVHKMQEMTFTCSPNIITSDYAYYEQNRHMT